MLGLETESIYVKIIINSFFKQSLIIPFQIPWIFSFGKFLS